MRNTFKLFGIITFLAIIGMSFPSCGDAGDGGNSGGNVTNEKAVYTSVDDEGNKYELTITPQSDRAAYEPKAGDTYTLKIFYVDGTTKTSVGTVTHEVKNGSTVTATLSVSDISYTVTLLTIMDDVRVFTEIKGTIPITSGNDDDPPTIEIELTLTPQVDNESKAVIGVILNKTALALDIGGTETLVATVLPTNAANKNVTWSSSNSSIAQVSQSGEVSAVAAGNATITVTTEEGDKAAICNVTVNEVIIGDIAVTGVTLNKTSTSILISGTETLTATVLPSNATNQNVTWSSSADSIATVSQDGLVTGLAAGSATITVSTEDGNKTATCAVTVTASAISVTGVTLNKTSVSLNVGGTETLIATIIPSNATNQNVTWSSNNNAVATVSNGLVKAISAGSATITVKTEDGNFTATCAVTVSAINVPVTGVTLNKATLSLSAGASETLIETIAPANATNKSVEWSSSDPSVATVTNSLVTGKAEGSATIKVTTADGGFTASCTVTVTLVYVKGVSLNKTTLEIGTGDTENLIAIFDPTNASNQNVKWSSSNDAVATVSEFGAVTGVFPGSATITVTTEDGNKTATCTVNVYLTPAGLAFYLSTLPVNSASSPHNIPLRIKTEVEFYLIKEALIGAPNKYVNLDLISSTITTIPYIAFNTGNSSWEGCTTLCGITIPNSVTSIGYWAFYECFNLASVTFEANSKITSIGNFAFSECTSLASITIPSSVTSIGNEVFYKTNLASITIPNSVTSIGMQAFLSCANLASVTFEANSKVTSIESGAFTLCTSLTSITIPNSVISIESGAFTLCTSLTSITIPNSVTSIRSSAFSNCFNLININIPNGVTSIEDKVFYHCFSLTSITIPNSVTSIGDDAFVGCESLTSITIPDSVKSIGDYAFNFCTNLVSVTFQGTIPSSGFNYAFDGNYSLREKFYATDPDNGTPGTFTTTNPGSTQTVWTRQ